MKKGAVFYHINFKFKNGERGQKLLIVLNNQKNSSPFLCSKTTSKIKYNIINEGCYPDKNIFVINKPPFNMKTWVQFDPNSLFELNASELLQQSFNKNIRIIGNLDENSMNAIVNCIKRSDDISEYQIDLLNRK